MRMLIFSHRRGGIVALLYAVQPGQVLAAVPLPSASALLQEALPWLLLCLPVCLLFSWLIAPLCRAVPLRWYPGVTALRLAIRRGDIAPWYQPVVCGQTGQTGGAEVLARWIQSDGDVALPGTFIETAERSGLIVSLTRQLMQQVARDMADIPLPRGFRLSVNVGATCLNDPLFAQDCRKLHEVLARQHALLTLEITERECLTLTPGLLSMLSVLRAQGVRMALDDFGTGWSGPLLLAVLPVDYVKLDAAFTNGAGLQDGEKDCLLNMAVQLIQLAHHSGAIVVAEGVEHDRQRTWLLSQGVLWQQGFYYARPMPAASFDEWMTGCRNVDGPEHGNAFPGGRQ